MVNTMVVLTNEKMVFRGTEDNMEYLFRAKTVMDALNKISEYLDSKKTKHYYFRFWDVVFEDGEYVKVDYGSHVDFFFICK